MFLENKYTKIYRSIIENSKAKNRKKGEEYYENHHIIPKSLGGSNSKDNLVFLTPREHFICHLILTKITVDSDRVKMIYALRRLANSNIKLTSRQYDIVRNLHISILKSTPKSEEHKRKISESNKGKKLSKEHRDKLRKPKSEDHKEKLRKPKINTENMGKYERTEEIRKRMSEAHIGLQTREKNPMFGRKHTEEVKKAHSEKMKGNQNGKGWIPSEDARAKMSARAKNRKSTLCIHCGNSYVGSNYTRWHGDNCKLKVVT
jgi:hypothetical protein